MRKYCVYRIKSRSIRIPWVCVHIGRSRWLLDSKTSLISVRPNPRITMKTSRTSKTFWTNRWVTLRTSRWNSRSRGAVSVTSRVRCSSRRSRMNYSPRRANKYGILSTPRHGIMSSWLNRMNSSWLKWMISHCRSSNSRSSCNHYNNSKTRCNN